MHLNHRVKSAAGFALVTLVMASPFVDYRHLTDASYEGDSRLLVWTRLRRARASDKAQSPSEDMPGANQQRFTGDQSVTPAAIIRFSRLDGYA